MTKDDFERWKVYHAATTGSYFHEFLAGEPGRTAWWFQALREFDLGEARAASDALALDVEAVARHPSQQLAWLVKNCRSRQAEQYRPELAQYARICGLCGNSGQRAVRTLGQFRFVTPMGNRVRRGVVPCECDAGNQFRYELDGGRRAFVSFDARTMIDERPAYHGADATAGTVADLRRAGNHDMAKLVQQMADRWDGADRVEKVDPAELTSVPHANAF